MKKRLLSLGLILIFIFALTGCNNSNNEKDSERLRVGVTISPLKYFVEEIGKDKVDVFSIIPDGSDAHTFDPKPKDLNELINSDIFVYNGLGMEEWIDSVLTTVDSEKVKVVEATSGVDPITINEEEDEHEEGEEHDHDHEEEIDDHEHSHGGLDPHTWLSLSDAIIEAENIKNALIEVDSENKNYYEENFEILKESLSNLKSEYEDKFKELANKNFVTGHAAFAYLCRDFGLTQESISNVFGEEGEVKPQDMEYLVSYCKENNVKVIFNESNASEDSTQTLAKEVGAEVVKIYSLESSEDDMNYLDGMKYNLETIYNSLK